MDVVSAHVLLRRMSQHCVKLMREFVPACRKDAFEDDHTLYWRALERRGPPLDDVDNSRVDEPMDLLGSFDKTELLDRYFSGIQGD